MSIITKAVFASAPKPLLWLAGILLATTLIASGTAAYYHGEMKDAEQAKIDAQATHDAVVGSLNTRISELGAVNENEHAVVEELAKRLFIAVGKRQQAEKALTDAITNRDSARRERDRVLCQLRQAQEASYANDETCAAWGARPVCGRITDGVLDQWQRARGSDGTGRQDGAGGNPGPAAGEDRPDADRRADPGTGAGAGLGLRHRGLQPAGGLFQQSPAGGDAVGRSGMGQQFGGKSALDQAGERPGRAAAWESEWGAGVIRVTLEFPNTMSGAEVFNSLYVAGAATTGNQNRRPTLTAIAADTESATAARQLSSRLAERGVRVQPDPLKPVEEDA